MTTFNSIFFHAHVEPMLRAALLVVSGFFIGRIMSASLVKAAIKHLSPQQSMLLRRFIFYIVLGLFIIFALDQLDFHIGALLGAAGIVTVAIGIASQTSMSNIISGLFMIGEKPFEVGHSIRVGETQGEVLSIDLLSVRMRTADNTMVRIPNETLIKSSIINLSFFPIRRADLKMGVPYKEDLDRVKKLLLEVANKNPLCLIEPKPLFQILGLGESLVELQFSVWSARPHFIELKNSVFAEIKHAFEKNGIKMGNQNSPFPIEIFSSKDKS